VSAFVLWMNQLCVTSMNQLCEHIFLCELINCVLVRSMNQLCKHICYVNASIVCYINDSIVRARLSCE